MRQGVAAVPSALYNELMAAYAEPHRHYHTAQHLEECFAHFDAIGSLAGHPAEVALALWFHDAIYDPKRQDNEEKSAGWARAAVLAAGAAPDAAARIHALVMATRHAAVPRGPDEEVLVDIDLSILGAAPARFDEYERQVRAEYAWVPDFLFRRSAGRSSRSSWRGPSSSAQRRCASASSRRRAPTSSAPSPASQVDQRIGWTARANACITMEQDSQAATTLVRQ